MSTENDDHDGGGEWDDPSDLTRLEDLSEFLHEEDPEVEAKLAAAQGDQDSLPDLPNEGEDLLGLDDLDDAEDLAEDLEGDSQEDQSFDQDSSSFDDQNDSKEMSFSEEQTNPAFDTSDLDTQNDQSDDPENDKDSGDSQEDWNDSDTSFDSDEGDAFEAAADEDSSDSSLDSNEDEQSWGDDDSLEEQSFDDNQDFEENNDYESSDFDSDEQSFSADDTNDFGDDSSEDSDGFDAQGEGEEGQLEDDYQEGSEESDQEDSQDDDSQYETNNFELPDPSEVNNSPPIQAATATNQNVNQSVPRENFQDLRDFGNAITYGVVTTGGNPPFSLILRNIKFEEDAEDIKILLREHGLVTDDNEETITQGLEQGSLLISQISEYSAIFLAHKMRRFDVELRIGLSDQLHPSKSYSREGRGLVSKYNLRQNHRESLLDLNTDIDVEDIKMSTTPTLDGYNIHRYIDVITAHTLIEEEELKRLHNINLSDSEDEEQDVVLGELLEQFPRDDNADSDALQFDLGLNEIYKELVVELRNEAFKIEANGVVGINFNITPLMMRSGNTTNIHYKITCSGNAVWIVDQQS